MSEQPNWKRKITEQAAIARLESVRTKKLWTPASPLHKAMHKAIAPLIREYGPAAGTLAARWPEIVGERIAKICEPVRLAPSKTGHTLYLRAPSAASTLIQHAADTIIDRVALATGAKIKSIKIVQTAAPKKAAANPAARSRRDITIQERQEIVNALANINSPVVRNALAELGEAVLASQPSDNRKSG